VSRTLRWNNGIVKAEEIKFHLCICVFIYAYGQYEIKGTREKR
jgi:hypothetical protein